MTNKKRRKPDAEKSNKKGRKILIIEDESLLAEMYKDKFIKEGFQISAASDPEEGLKMAEMENPDLVILDIVMPKGGGIEFLKKRLQNPAILSIPTIAFSNYDYLATQEEVKKLGVKDYLIKSDYTPSQLVSKINYFLKTKPNTGSK